MAKKVKPNVVAGGSAIDLGNGLFYMRGKTHKQGGIDVGKNPRTGIEVENGEVMQITPNNIRVFSAQPILNGISPANALLMGGNPNNIFNAQEAWKQANRVTDDGRKFAPGGKRKTQIVGRKTIWDNDKTDKGDMYYDIVKARYISTMDSLKRNGFTYDDAVRLAPMIVQQNILEGGWILNRNDNNYGGMKVNNGETTLSFDTVEDFYDAYIKMLDSRWGASKGKENNWRNAKNLDDWARILNREDLGLTTKEKYNEYNSKHKDNPVYLYAPEWHNNNRSYREHLRKAEDRVNAYFNWIQEDYQYPKWGDEEKNFRDWYDTYARAHNLDLNPDAKEHYYDYRAYYKNRTKEQANEEWKLDSHLPDTYKLPGHPTFSIESIYSTRKTPGGTWKQVGLGPVYDEQFVDSKYTKRLKTYKNVSFKYGGIHIKPSKRGTFTAAAKRHNMGVQEFARTVLNNKENYSAAMIKKANFARNASKWNKKEFGGDMTKQYFITPNNIYKLGGDIRKKAVLGTDGNNYERFIDGDGLMKYRIGNTVYSKDGFSRVTGMSLDEIDSYFDAIDNEGRGEITPSSEINIEPSVVTAYNRANPGVLQNTIGFNDSLIGTSYYGPQRANELPVQQTPTQPTQSTQPATPQRSQYSAIRIDTSGRHTRGLGVTPLRPYDGRPIEAQAQTPASGSQSSSTGGQRRTPTVVSTPTSNNAPVVNQTPTQPTTPATTRVSSYPTLEPLVPITSPGAVTPQTIVDNNRRSPVKLRGNGINIRNGADWLGLGINLAGNLAASLINRSAIKGMRYVDAPIPLSAQKLKTKINVNPQVDQIRENVAGQERLIADNTADSRVALARRQRVRNLGSEQFQSLMGQRENMETQLINRDRLNRQGVDAQNVTQYNQWRRGAYDFENRRKEMLAENAVAGINNAAEAIAGERGILARREGRNRDILDAALIAATSPNAQNVIGSKEFAKFLEQLGYTGDFSLLRKRLNIG